MFRSTISSHRSPGVDDYDVDSGFLSMEGLFSDTDTDEEFEDATDTPSDPVAPPSATVLGDQHVEHPDVGADPPEPENAQPDESPQAQAAAQPPTQLARRLAAVFYGVKGPKIAPELPAF